MSSVFLNFAFLINWMLNWQTEITWALPNCGIFGGGINTSIRHFISSSKIISGCNTLVFGSQQVKMTMCVYCAILYRYWFVLVLFSFLQVEFWWCFVFAIFLSRCTKCCGHLPELRLRSLTSKYLWKTDQCFVKDSTGKTGHRAGSHSTAGEGSQS